jgi:toxin-antitoxin system PIN domain toxin
MKGTALLDVNVLVALFDPAHPHHGPAHEWFALHRKQRWATCAVTQMGCTRVLANPRYPSFKATVSQVVSHLSTFCAAGEHEFWDEAISLTDESRFDATRIASHQGITDAYLLALARKNCGRLVTFDAALAANGNKHVTLLGRALA